VKMFFLTLDLEEWYHLEYVNRSKLDSQSNISTIDMLNPFFEMLDKYNIKITVFVLGELVSKHAELIRSISQKGHEIAIHGWNHDLLYKKDTSQFLSEISRAKEVLEGLTGKSVIGYRAPCFSMSNKKLELLRNIGIKYDSSYIKFSDHPLYGELNLQSYEKISDLIYKESSFLEYEIPTISLFGRRLPISGGGYFRLFPRFLFKLFFRFFLKNHSNFIMYIHPFELSSVEIKLNNITLLNKFRLNVGRRSNLVKLDNLLNDCIKNGFVFKTMKEFCDEVGAQNS